MNTIPTAGNSVANGFPQKTDLHQSTLRAAATRESFSDRLAILDAAKGIAACVIVFHHLTFYGRPSDLAMEIAPGIIQFLFDEARMIVQLFLVLGGFGLAWAHSSGYISWSKASQTFIKRYLRLLVPFATMLGLLVLSAAMVGTIEPGNPIVESISLLQILSHLLFLQGILGYENLTAGAWYLCIDIQFAGLFLFIGATISHLHKRFQSVSSLASDMSIVLSCLGVVSAWYWNRQSSLDHSVLYFMAPFALGALVAWERRKKVSMTMLALYACAIALSLFVDFRPRIAVALASGGLLWWVITYGSHLRAPLCLVWLGKISYSLFVSHFLVLSLTMFALEGWMDASPYHALTVMLISFAASILAAPCLYYGVELPFQQWLKNSSQVAPRNVLLPATATR